MSELGDILRDAVSRLFGDLVTRETLEAAEKGEWPAALWDAVEEAGLCRALVPEMQGGVGAQWAEAFIIVNAAGRHAAPIPLPETILAAWLLARADMEIPDGPLTVVDTPGLDLTRGGGGWRAGGQLAAVPWGRHAGHAVMVVSADGAPRLACVPLAEAAVTPDLNIAREPRDTLVFDGVAVEAGDAPDGVSSDTIRVYGAMLRAAQMAGAAERALNEAVQYAKDRVQFSRPISKFQAIQHQLATLAAQASQAGIAAESAFRAADRGDPAFETACAKVVAGEAAATATTVAHQVHGAIGFTYEHVLHFATRRLWSWRAEFGSESAWAEMLGRQATARGADALWPDLTARQGARGLD
jgi:acyl-CoA dehydrogenase